jgi:peroxiredoxin
MSKSWRRDFLVTLFLVAAGLGTVQAQEQSGTNNDALGPDYQQGKSALVAEKYEDAIKAFKRANKAQNEACSPCLVGMAYAMVRMGDLNGALSSTEKALALAKTNEQRAEAYTMRGDLLLGTNEEKKRADAEAAYRAAVRQNTEAPEPHLKLAVALFKEVKDSEGQEELNEYLRVAPSGKFAGYARSLLVNPRRARENYAPNFRVATLKGNSVQLADLAGKVVVLDFWATWCHPCVASVGELKELTRKYSQEKVVLISVSADEDEQKWKEFIGKKGMEWEQYWDKDGSVRKLFNVRAYPTYLVIDQEGIIRERIVGLNSQQSVVYRLKEKLQTLLAAHDKG